MFGSIQAGRWLCAQNKQWNLRDWQYIAVNTVFYDGNHATEMLHPNKVTRNICIDYLFEQPVDQHEDG